MDINQFRKHLARQQNLQESPQGRALYDHIKYLYAAPSLKDKIRIANGVWADVDTIASRDKFSFNRKFPHLLSRLETLIDMLESGKIDPDDAEALTTEIGADLLKL